MIFFLIHSDRQKEIGPKLIFYSLRQFAQT